MDSHQTLDACESRWLIRIMRIKYKDRITNETIRQRTQQLPVSNKIRQMRLKWLGYVLRMKDNRLTKSVHQWYPTGKRSRGRPNKRWMDCWRGSTTSRCNKVWKTAGRQRMTLNDIAADRQQWRNLTAASMAEISWTMITWPDCNLAMSFAVTQSNQLLFQSLCN